MLTRHIMRTIVLILTAIMGPIQVIAEEPKATPQSHQVSPSQGDDLREIAFHLENQNWQAADTATRRILHPFLHPNGDIFGEPQPTNIPLNLMQQLDHLWTEASGGRFGWRVQQQLWAEVSAQYPDPVAATQAFGDRVGWRRSEPDSNNFVAPEWLTEPELTHTLAAPIGHLPWAGVEWARIEAMLTAQSCGSCMIDALYLQGDRFGRYLPPLFSWIQTVLTNGPVSSPPRPQCQDF